MKKILSSLAVVVAAAFTITGCGSSNPEDLSGRFISVISREDGSGTRGAFIELFGVLEKGEDGTSTDQTTVEATIGNTTAIVLNNVASDPAAIGYVSIGSLNDNVKALSIDGVSPTESHVVSGEYKISRPFNIAVNGTPSDITQDFINFILSDKGQAVVTDNHYVAVDHSPPAFHSNGATGRIVIAGSSSVTPIMEKLEEAYEAANTGAQIDIQTNDTSTGMQAAISGTADIGMASRDLTDAESSQLTPIAIAIDGIAVIVNTENPINNLSSDDVKEIFIGERTSW